MKRISVRDVFKNCVSTTLEFVEYGSVTIDSRKVERGDIFVALKGEKTDGHLYIDQAFEKGAICCLISDERFYDRSKKLILVRDGFLALKQLSDYNLSLYKGKKIVITGSVGKTSTKALIARVLSNRFNVYEAYKNYNNELGIAIVTSNIDHNSEIAVFEIGTNNPGEIALLSSILRPDVAVVTNVGHSHIGRFGDIAHLRKEKLSLLDYLVGDGIAWIHDGIEVEGIKLPKNTKKFGFNKGSDIYLEEITTDGDLNFIVSYRGVKYSFCIHHPYKHFALNALPAIGIALDEGLHYEEIYRGLLAFTPVEGRGSIIKVGNSIIIDDSYNAGFEAMVSAIKNLCSFGENKWAILGEMAEIDGFEDKLYEELKKVVGEQSSIRFYLVGERYESFKGLDNVMVFRDKQMLFDEKLYKDDGVFLVKASRGKRFEEIVEYIKKVKNAL
ncbi:MAG: UDP-N-acetylmuramoyl-tripeptide--D-alanyl-D-alanine ligase [Calditerrivibrio sp.]|nr:UDP-N-acetylmuramoyl-tripeptide--D-alanyl-D-alanine ligase [Calditerrivibrio sp.]